MKGLIKVFLKKKIRELNTEGLMRNYSKEVQCLGGAYVRKYSVIMLTFALILNYLEQKVTLTKIELLI